MLRWFTEKIEEILCEVRCIHRDVIRILKWIALKKIDFVQVGGCMNFSLVRGTTGTFQAVLTPSDGAQQAGSVPQWNRDDPSVTLEPSADGLSCNVTVPLGTTMTSFNLSITAISSDPSIGTLSQTHNITVTEPTPPPPPALTAIDFVQTAG